MAELRLLPVPVAEIWDWQLRAACRDVDAAMFFPPDRERGPHRATREAQARRVCARCPVIAECRRHALAVHEPYGVWGGLTEAERAHILRAPDRVARGRVDRDEFRASGSS
jgi:WhiB family redox-sensing transcriptional regulator